MSSSLCTAIVLKYTDYGETDRIAHLLTKEHGLISAMVRGARVSQKKYAGMIDLGNQLEVAFSSTKGDIWTLKSASTSKSMHRIRNSLPKIAFLSYACELISHAAQAGNPEPRLYGLLEQLLQILEHQDGKIGPRFRIAFELKALTFAGYRPQLQTCMACLKKISPPLSLFTTEGGVFHDECLPKVDGPVPTIISLPLPWLRQAIIALKTPMADSLSVEMLSGPNWAFSDLFVQIYQKPLKSKAFLATIESQ